MVFRGLLISVATILFASQSARAERRLFWTGISEEHPDLIRLRKTFADNPGRTAQLLKQLERELQITILVVDAGGAPAGDHFPTNTQGVRNVPLARETIAKVSLTYRTPHLIRAVVFDHGSKLIERVPRFRPLVLADPSLNRGDLFVAAAEAILRRQGPGEIDPKLDEAKPVVPSHIVWLNNNVNGTGYTNAAFAFWARLDAIRCLVTQVEEFPTPIEKPIPYLENYTHLLSAYYHRLLGPLRDYSRTMLDGRKELVLKPVLENDSERVEADRDWLETNFRRAGEKNLHKATLVPKRNASQFTIVSQPHETPTGKFRSDREGDELNFEPLRDGADTFLLVEGNPLSEDSPSQIAVLECSSYFCGRPRMDRDGIQPLVFIFATNVVAAGGVFSFGRADTVRTRGPEEIPMTAYMSELAIERGGSADGVDKPLENGRYSATGISFKDGVGSVNASPENWILAAKLTTAYSADHRLAAVALSEFRDGAKLPRLIFLCAEGSTSFSCEAKSAVGRFGMMKDFNAKTFDGKQLLLWKQAEGYSSPRIFEYQKQ